MRRSIPHWSHSRRQGGFTLMELLIAMIISLLGLSAVGSMMMNFSKKRTSITQTLSAQDNGVMALYRLERDVAQAGYGLMNLQSCATILNGTSASFTHYPVQITWGGAGVSDSIAVKWANPTTGAPGTELDNSSGTSMTGSQYNVRSNVGFSAGDVVVSTLACAATTVGAITNTTTIPYSYSGTALASSSQTGFLAYFGQAGQFINRQYAIGPTAMTVADYPAFTTNNLVDNIVYLKAQYGVAGAITGNPATVARWVSGATTLNGTGCSGSSIHPACVVAIRIGVVARSAAVSSEPVDQPNPLPLLPVVFGSDSETFALPAGSSNLRYRAYSTVIPLNNVIWGR